MLFTSNSYKLTFVHGVYSWQDITEFHIKPQTDVYSWQDITEFHIKPQTCHFTI